MYDVNVEITEFDKIFLTKSFVWLTDPEIKYLTLSPDIHNEEQQKWFSSLNNRDDYKIWGIAVKGIPIGAVGLKKINMKLLTAEYFGYIGEKEYWGQGIGTKMLSFAIDEARKLGIKRLDIHVSDDNKRAIHLYEKLGFKDMGGGMSRKI